jgi:hypothetical protein
MATGETGMLAGFKVEKVGRSDCRGMGVNFVDMMAFEGLYRSSDV